MLPRLRWLFTVLFANALVLILAACNTAPTPAVTLTITRTPWIRASGAPHKRCLLFKPMVVKITAVADDVIGNGFCTL